MRADQKTKLKGMITTNAVIVLARKVAPTDAIVMIPGETGTGKEVFS